MESEIRHQLKSGLLTISFPRFESLNLAYVLASKIRSISHIEIQDVDLTIYPLGDIEKPETYKVSSVLVEKNLSIMARFSRMCYELYISNTLTDLSKEDVDALYDLPMHDNVVGFHNILNIYRFKVSPSGIDDIAEGHILAKSFMTIMTS
jgi:hypothetical protein